MSFGNIKGQEEERLYQEFRDQHGRLWGANIEKKTGEPCEVLRPCGWTAPQGLKLSSPQERRAASGFLIPPEDLEIRKMVPRAERARRGYDLFIDYERWLAKWDQRQHEHQQKFRDYAFGMTKDTVKALDLMQNPTTDLLREVGSGPKPPREFIEAAAAGNAWALGNTDVVPKKAQPILDAFLPALASNRSRRPIGEDPFADEDDEIEADEFAEAVVPRMHDPLAESADSKADLEEQFDPDGRGGKREPVGRAAKARGATRRTKAGTE